jgi:hypothetical protein
MSDRWVFLTAFLTVVLIVAGAFVIPEFFAYELVKSLIYLAIALLVFFGEDRFSYMLGIVVPPLWFILDILLGELFGDFSILFGFVTGKPSRPMDTPLHGFSLLTEILLVVLCVRVWRKQVSEKFFGKTFGICLAIAIAYVAILAGWHFGTITGTGLFH